jgi:hypothetical protein
MLDEQAAARTRCYHVQCYLFETSPKILAPVLHRAWRESTGNHYFKPQSGQFEPFLPEGWEQRVGWGDGYRRIKDGMVDKFDITSFALILVDTPALLSEREPASAVRDLRRLRNNFVHEIVGKSAELSQEAFDKLWTTITRHLSLLARWAGGDFENLLQRERNEILSQVIDKNKAEEFASLCSRLEGLEGRQRHVEELTKSCQRDMADLEKKHEHALQRIASLAKKHDAARDESKAQLAASHEANESLKRELGEIKLAQEQQHRKQAVQRADREHAGEKGVEDTEHVGANVGAAASAAAACLPLRRGRSANRSRGSSGSAWARLEFGDGTHVPVCTALDADFCIGGYRAQTDAAMRRQYAAHYHSVHPGTLNL